MWPDGTQSRVVMVCMALEGQIAKGSNDSITYTLLVETQKKVLYPDNTEEMVHVTLERWFRHKMICSWHERFVYALFSM